MFGFQSLNAQNYVEFSVNNAGGCGPVNVSFTNNSVLNDTVEPVHYEWYINGNIFSSDYEPTDTILPAGHYDISLWIYDDAGFSGDYNQELEIQGFPNIRTIPEEFCPGEDVRFFIEGNAEWVIWEFPDGTTSKQWEETYVFNNEGTYTVKATGSTNECGLDSSSIDVIVANTSVPQAEIWINGDWFCPNDEIKFSSPEAAQHQWVITKNTIAIDTLYNREIYYAFSDTGQYIVNLTTTNACGNTATDSHIINIGLEIYPNAWFNVDYGPNPNCPNYAFKFEAEASGQFEWNFGDGSFAYERTVYNSYSDTGTYEVTLITSNGCGYSDTIINNVNVNYYPDNNPFVDIRFKNMDSNIDTLRVCPGTEVSIENDSEDNDDIEFTWYVDGNTYHSKNLVYPFSTPGLNEVMLIAINKCNGKDTALKYVRVDNQMAPISTNLTATPLSICPGEEVYFYNDGDGGDDWNKDYIQNLIYEVDFGDGETMSNITGQTVDFPPVLAAHSYATEDTFHFIFTAQNTCGIKDTLEGDIFVNDDASRTPFYYVGNSTTENEKGGEMKDWSIPVPMAHQFIVPVELLNWDYMSTMDSIVYIYVWYGNIDPNGDPGPPDGVVEVHAPDTVSVYVPYNVIEPSIGIAAVWYCDTSILENDVQLYTLPINSPDTIHSFPIEPEGFTDLSTLTEISEPLTLDGMMWDGSCANAKNFRNRWLYQSNQGYFVALNIWEEEGDTLRYNLNYGPDRWDTPSFVSGGTVQEIEQGMLSFTQENGSQCPMSSFEYSYIVNEATGIMTLTNSSDTCTSRISLLTAKPFFKDNENWDYDYNRDRTGCPGDNIELYIAGGISYVWNLTDGTTSTLPQFYHVYDTVGEFNEYVSATNACGRVDTIFTKVIIDTTNVPEAFWGANYWNVRRMEPIQFMVNNDNDDYGNNVYLWEFGDGASSTEKTPTHYYTIEGDYDVTLTVTNGCGSSSETQTIWVKQETASCIAKFTFDINDKTVSFNNNSIGEISSYWWDFGNGKVSQLENPVHVFDDYGVYEVTLIIHDTITNCSDEVSMMLTLGVVECFANFSYQVNTTTQNVIFNDESLGNIDSWYWEFGDGTFSTDTFPVHHYPNDGVYPVCLTISDTISGCISSSCKEITIGDVDIHADFNYFVDPITGLVSFSDISNGEITNWYWEFGDGAWDTIPNTSHIYQESGEYEVCLGTYNMFTDAFDDVCKYVIVITDTADIITKAKFTYMIDPATSTANFVDNSTGEITNWYWTFGDGTYASGDTVSHEYSAPGFYNVCLIVFNSNTGERSELCKTLQVGVLTCNVNSSFGYYINPATNEVSFNDKSTGTANAWFWDFGDGQTSSAKNPNHTYAQAGFYLVSLGIRDTINDCNDYYADFIQVGTADCSSDFEYTITDLSTNTVQFTDKSIGDIADYFWYFDDGSFSTDTNPSHIYNAPGLYAVSLTITDATGSCFDFRIKDVQVGTVNCDASFTVYVDSTTNDAYFTNSSVGGTTEYYWLFGDGQYHIGADPVHHYVAPGYFTVNLNTYNSGDGCMDNFEKVVLIGNSSNDVEADFFYQADFATRKIDFFNESLGENLTYIWDFGDGTTSTDENPTHTFTEGGYQFICLTATNANGVINTTCKLVQSSDDASDDCLAQFNYDIDTASLDVTFIDNSYGDPDVYAWDFGDGSTSTDANPVHNYTQKDFYLVELHTTNSTTQCESYDQQYINVGVDNDSIQAIFSYEVDTTTKGKPGGKPVDIIGIGHGGGSSLTWDFGDNNKLNGKVTSTTLRPTHIYENPGKYNVCLTISDPVINQSDTYCDSVKIGYETAVKDSICEGDTYDFFGTSLTNAGEYKHTTVAGDGVDSTIYLTLKVNAIPTTPTVTLSGTTLTSSSATSNQWYLNGTAITGATDQTYTATASGEYTVVVTNASGCYSTSDATTVTLVGMENLEQFGIEIYPNPMQSFTRINYNLVNTTQINITLFDASGNQMETLVNTYKPAGDHQIIWKDPELANGIYYLVFRTNEGMVTKKLIIQK